jgi:hypothetical protein
MGMLISYVMMSPLFDLPKLFPFYNPNNYGTAEQYFYTKTGAIKFMKVIGFEILFTFILVTVMLLFKYDSHYQKVNKLI